MIQIVKPTVEQAEIIEKLVRESIFSSLPIYYPTGAAECLADYHSVQLIAEDIAAGRVFAALEDGRYIGTVTVDGEEISRLFVQTDCRGRGVGSSLMDVAEAEVFKTCDRAILYAVWTGVKLYMDRGYTMTDFVEYPLENGSFFCYLLMEIPNPNTRK